MFDLPPESISDTELEAVLTAALRIRRRYNPINRADRKDFLTMWLV